MTALGRELEAAGFTNVLAGAPVEGPPIHQNLVVWLDGPAPDVNDDSIDSRRRQRLASGFWRCGPVGHLRCFLLTDCAVNPRTCRPHHIREI